MTGCLYMGWNQALEPEWEDSIRHKLPDGDNYRQFRLRSPFYTAQL